MMKQKMTCKKILTMKLQTCLITLGCFIIISIGFSVVAGIFWVDDLGALTILNYV